jgi:Tol biopolymer transport system component
MRHVNARLAGLVIALLTTAPVVGRSVEFSTTQVTVADVAAGPDANDVVFSLLGHLFRIPLTGGTASQLTFGSSYDDSPAYSPDGRSIAFISDRDRGEANVFVLSLSSGQITQLTHDAQAGVPVWTPDGKAIVYLRYLG